MAESDEELIRKIGLLLKKAEGTDNEHEADAFYAKANDLMVRHAIEEQRVRMAQMAASGRTIEDPLVEDFMFSSYAHHRDAKETLLEVVAKSRSVRWIHYTNRKDSNHDRPGNNGLHESQWTRLIGYKSDIEQTKMLYLSLLIQSQRFANEDWTRLYGKGAKHSSWEDGRVGKFTWLGGHMNGFSERIGVRFDELNRIIYEEVKDGSALILDKDSNILEWMYEHGLARRPAPPVYYCWAIEPEINRPFNADGRTKSKKWMPRYCIIKKADAETPHPGEHQYTYRPYSTAVSYYVPKGRTASYEGRHAGRSAADRADIGQPRAGSGSVPSLKG